MRRQLTFSHLPDLKLRRKRASEPAAEIPSNRDAEPLLRIAIPVVLVVILSEVAVATESKDPEDAPGSNATSEHFHQQRFSASAEAEQKIIAGI